MATRPIVQLTRSGVALFGSTRDLERLRREFDRYHCIRLPQLLEPELWTWIQRLIPRSRFRALLQLQGDCKELCMAREDPVLAILDFLANDPRLFGLIRQMTGCGPIARFAGRVYRMVPGKGHTDAWHDDVGNYYLVAMSVNLSPGIYRGGILQIRDKRSKRILSEVANTGFGDAVLFKLSEDLEHRLTDVEGPSSKTAYAGWFRSRPSYRRSLKKWLSQLNGTLKP